MHTLPLLLALHLPLSGPLPQILGKDAQLIGPFVGALGPRQASVFMRASLDGPPLVMQLVDANGKVLKELSTTPQKELDLCVRWDLAELQPATSYAIAAAGQRIFFKTADEIGAPTRASVVFGSCADDRPGLVNPVWAAIKKDAPDAVVLIGDTPYIDSTDKVIQRRRYREFLGSPTLDALLCTTAYYGIWDDHDFAFDGADGTAPGKEESRAAFLLYHVNPSAGEMNQGVYTRIRIGAADVFLLDTRWFSGTEKSFADPAQPTLLGAQQWAWLQKELLASTAPFKLLVSGMVWNGAVRKDKPDYWMKYAYEREALFKFLAEKKIEGVVLVSGDVHRSRALVFGPTETGLAYPLTELVTSPLGTSVMAQAEVPDPDLVFDRGEKHSYLHVSARSGKFGAKLTASFRTASPDVKGGASAPEMFKVDLDAASLRPKATTSLAPRADEGGKARTEAVMARSKAGTDADVVFLGDSITQGWEDAGKETWAQRYAARKALELGVGGDRTQHVLWRIDHGQLDGLKPKVVVLMIGTNNSGDEADSARDIADGIGAIVSAIRHKLPGTKVLLLAIFPRGETPNPQREKNAEASKLASALADDKSVFFLDIGPKFTGPDGSISKEIMPDSVHLSPKGYAIWAEALEPKLAELLAR